MYIPLIVLQAFRLLDSRLNHDAVEILTRNYHNSAAFICQSRVTYITDESVW